MVGSCRTASTLVCSVRSGARRPGPSKTPFSTSRTSSLLNSKQNWLKCRRRRTRLFSKSATKRTLSPSCRGVSWTLTAARRKDHSRQYTLTWSLKKATRPTASDVHGRRFGILGPYRTLRSRTCWLPSFNRSFNCNTTRPHNHVPLAPLFHNSLQQCYHNHPHPPRPPLLYSTSPPLPLLRCLRPWPPLPRPRLRSGLGRASSVGPSCAAVSNLPGPQSQMRPCKPVSQHLRMRRPRSRQNLASEAAAVHTVRLDRLRKTTTSPALLKCNGGGSGLGRIQNGIGCCKAWRQPCSTEN